MSDINNCPMCKKPVFANGFVSCQNSDCTEHDIKYLYHQVGEHVKELNEFGLVVDKAIHNG